MSVGRTLQPVTVHYHYYTQKHLPLIGGGACLKSSRAALLFPKWQQDNFVAPFYLRTGRVIMVIARYIIYKYLLYTSCTLGHRDC